MELVAQRDHSLPAPMDLMDEAEARLVAIGMKLAGPGESPDGLPVQHHFTPGLYCREIFMPRGAVVSSKIHKTEHPFVLSKGACLVFTEAGEWIRLDAPHFGITKPGTRRFLVILEDTIWTTFHVTDSTDVAEIDREILVQRTNPLLEKLT